MLSLMASTWISVSESVSMARETIRTETTFCHCHTERQRRSEGGRLPGR
jgi:hypothetical protein